MIVEQAISYFKKRGVKIIKIKSLEKKKRFYFFI